MREEDTVCVGSDGLQYCKVCGEAKEAFFPKGDFMGMKKHSRQCACDRASVLTRAGWKSGHLRMQICQMQ